MSVEASDIVALLHRMGERNTDPVCEHLAFMAERGMPILEVCSRAIEALSDRGKRLTDYVMDLSALQPQPYLIVKGEVSETVRAIVERKP